jgi:hypothetical protein
MFLSEGKARRRDAGVGTRVYSEVGWDWKEHLDSRCQLTQTHSHTPRRKIVVVKLKVQAAKCMRPASSRAAQGDKNHRDDHEGNTANSCHNGARGHRAGCAAAIGKRLGV